MTTHQEDEDERRRKGIVADGEVVRRPLMLTDGTRTTATLAERRAFDVPAEMCDAAAADYIAGYKVASSATAQLDGSLHRPGYRYSHMIQAASQVRDGVSLADAERARDAAFQERIRRDANAWRRPTPTPTPTHAADASAQVTDIRSLSLEDARKARDAAWHARNERDRNAWKQPARPIVGTAKKGENFPQFSDASPALDPRTTPLAELRRAADKARAERDERDRNAWRREPSPYVTKLRNAESDLRNANADDPIARAEAAERLRIATVGGRGA